MQTPWPPHDPAARGTALSKVMVRFPDSRAFVIQLSDETDPAARLPVGRIEHVESGLRERIASREEIWAFIERVLAREARREGECR